MLTLALLGVLGQSAAGQSGDRRADLLVDQLRGVAPNATTARQSLRAALVSLDQEARPTLSQRLADLQEPDALWALEHLASFRDDRALDHMIAAGKGQFPLPVQRAAVGAFSQFVGGGDALEARALSAALDHVAAADTELATIALGIVRWGAQAEAWNPVLQVVQVQANLPGPLAQRVLREAVQTLGSILHYHPDPMRVVDVWRLESIIGAEPALRILLASRSDLARSFLVRMLEECYPRAEDEGDAGDAGDAGLLPTPGAASSFHYDMVFAEGGTAEALRPWSPTLRELALEGVAMGRDPASGYLFELALTDPDAQVRMAVLRLMSFVLDEATEQRVLPRVIAMLTDGNLQVRKAAHRWLRRATGAEVSLSFPAWQRWLREQARERETQAALAALIKGDGFESLEQLQALYGFATVDDVLAHYGYESLDALLEAQAAPAAEDGDVDEEVDRDPE